MLKLSSQEGLIDYKGSPTITKIDLVVLRHVLEHIFDLNSFINHIRCILKDDGCLFVEVPDWSWLDRKTDPLIFEHLNQFSTYNLIYLMKRLGWQCEAVEKSIVANDPATPNRVQRLLFKPTKVPVLFSNKIASTVKDFYQDNYGKGNAALDNFISRLDSQDKVQFSYLNQA
jgi:SAM-dependent methyltransferase